MATIRFISGEAALANFIEGIRAQAVDRLQVSGYNATRRLGQQHQPAKRLHHRP